LNFQIERPDFEISLEPPKSIVHGLFKNSSRKIYIDPQSLCIYSLRSNCNKI